MTPLRLAPDPEKPRDEAPRSPELQAEWDKRYELSCRATFFPCIDMGEPSCWACHAWSSSDNPYLGHANAYNLAGWLTKCHLLGVAHGGSDHPANLVLLCHRCHRLQPDHDYVTAIKWVESFSRRIWKSMVAGDELARDWFGFRYDEFVAYVDARMKVWDEMEKNDDESWEEFMERVRLRTEEVGLGAWA